MKRDDLRGQLSIEFMIVLTGLLIVVATVTMPIYNQARFDAEKMTKLTEAREAANTLANALNNLYASGPGSKLTIEYWLPQGVVAVYMGGYESLEIDGVYTTDESVPRNGRADVQIRLDFNNDGMWDNNREAVVIVDTLLPSRWDENAAARGDSWVKENCVHVEDTISNRLRQKDSSSNHVDRQLYTRIRVSAKDFDPRRNYRGRLNCADKRQSNTC